MGASSSNIADAVSNVANYVNNSTSVNDTQVSSLANQIKLNSCQIKLDGNFNAKESAKLLAKNQQIVSAKQDANVANNIQQQTLQQAQSTVGTLGIGYADASNCASELVNTTNQISNAMVVGALQYASVDNKFDCEGTTIKAKNLTIGFNSSVDFLSTQTLNNDQVANIVNDISQTISQKATATVEGISGMLLLILCAIAVIIYVAMKPLSSGGVKLIVGVLLCFLVVGVIILMYIKKSPPFFNDLQECINNSSLGMGGGSSENVSNCIEQKPGKIYLNNPPLKYIYGISPSDMSKPSGNLVQIAIASQSSGNSLNGAGPNGGYTVDTAITLQNKIKNYVQLASDLNIPNIPNPLSIPCAIPVSNPLYSQYSCSLSYSNKMSGTGAYFYVPTQYSNADISSPNDANAGICTPSTIQLGEDNSNCSYTTGCPSSLESSCFQTTNDSTQAIANLNSSDWEDYLSMSGKYPPTLPWNNTNIDEQTLRALFSRFVLCDIIGNIEMHHYVLQDDIVKFLDENNNTIIRPVRDAIKEGYSNFIYKYHPYSFPNSWRNGIMGSGFIYGQVGIVDNNKNKFVKFMKNIGGWILLAILGLIFLFMGYIWYKNRNKNLSGSATDLNSNKGFLEKIKDMFTSKD